tara:strand:+ start:2953 stop:3255 length:303 start_codon:yes stop_codon:yes gene_type:complete
MAEFIGLIFGGLAAGGQATEMGVSAEKRKKDKEEKKTRIDKAKKVVGDVDDKISSLVEQITKEPKMPPVRRRKKEYSDKEKIQKTLKDTRQQLELLIKRL